MEKKKSRPAWSRTFEMAMENYLVYGIHIQNRRIDFGPPANQIHEEGNDIEYTSISLAIRAIDLMVELSSKPIELHMTCYGGDPEFMMALYDKIQESPVKFIFYGRGHIGSSAVWIMCGCDERYLSENTQVLIHNGSTLYEKNTEMKLTDSGIDYKNDARLQEKLNRILAQNSRMPKKFWDAIVQRDCVINAQEAFTLGLIEGVIPSRKRGNFRQKRISVLSKHPAPRTLKALSQKLMARISLPVAFKDLKVHVPKEKFESFEEYDNTDEVLTIVPDNNE